MPTCLAKNSGKQFGLTSIVFLNFSAPKRYKLTLSAYKKLVSGFNFESSALSPKPLKMSLASSPPGLVNTMYCNLVFIAYCFTSGRVLPRPHFAAGLASLAGLHLR